MSCCKTQLITTFRCGLESNRHSDDSVTVRCSKMLGHGTSTVFVSFQRNNTRIYDWPSSAKSWRQEWNFPSYNLHNPNACISRGVIFISLNLASSQYLTHNLYVYFNLCYNLFLSFVLFGGANLCTVPTWFPELTVPYRPVTRSRVSCTQLFTLKSVREPAEQVAPNPWLRISILSGGLCRK